MTRLHRAYGPPGTGKTTWLARNALAATQRHGQENVAVASLTRAAAAEVAGRDTGIPARLVGTLHAHAYRALDRPALAETGEGVKDWNERAPAGLRLSGAAVRDPEWASPEDLEIGGRSGEADRLLSDANILRARLTPRERWPGGRDGSLNRFYDRWCEWKRTTRRLDFSDLIETALTDVASLDVAVLMLDEAQDMSALEMSLALKWGAAAEELVAVGDPDQNLYQWRGSDPSAFTGPEAATERTLSQSHRVPQAAHDLAVRWIQRVADRPAIEYDPTPEPGSVQPLHADWRRSPEAIAQHAAERSSLGSTVMILASCAYMIDPIIGALRDLGHPFWNPYRPTNGRWNPLAGLARLKCFLRPHLGEEIRLWTWDDLRRALEPLDAKTSGLARGVKAHIDGKCEKDRFGDAPYRDVQVDPGFLIELFKDPDAAARFGAGDVDWWEASLLTRFRPQLAFACEAYRRRGAEALTAEPRVIVGTIHSVKGGEADEVIVLPDLSLAAHYGQDGQGGGWAMGDRDPILRQFYVAFTRCRRDLWIADAASELSVDARELVR